MLGLKVKNDLRKGPVKHVAIGGLANEWISYILTSDQYLHGEGYESSVSFYGPELGRIISAAAISTASSLSQQK